MTRRALLALLPAAALAAGCGGDNPPPLAMTATPESAKAALEAALNDWKAGKTAADLKAAQPPVYFTDPDFTRGRKLTAFTLTDAGAAAGTAIRFTVSLTFDDKKSRSVGLRVATTPVVSIYREEAGS